MKHLLIFFFVFPILLQAAPIDSLDLATYLSQNSIQAKETPQGLYYSFENEGSGALPKAGDYVMLHYTGRRLDGKIFDQSPENEPFVFQVGYRQVIKGWDLGIPMFRVGSKGHLYIPPQLAYGKAGAGSQIPPDAALIFDIEVLKILNFEEYDQYMVELEERERAAYEQQQAKQFLEDKKLIHEYAMSHRIKTRRTDSGLNYGISKKGKGEAVKMGDRLKVYYEGYLLDDTVFDSALEQGKKPFEFTLAKGEVIKGWEEGLQYFKEGDEGWLLIPSKLAYGAREIREEVDGRKVEIPANSVLVFKIKVEEINRE